MWVGRTQAAVRYSFAASRNSSAVGLPCKLAICKLRIYVLSACNMRVVQNRCRGALLLRLPPGLVITPGTTTGRAFACPKRGKVSWSWLTALFCSLFCCKQVRPQLWAPSLSQDSVFRKGPGLNPKYRSKPLPPCEHPSIHPVHTESSKPVGGGGICVACPQRV